MKSFLHFFSFYCLITLVIISCAKDDAEPILEQEEETPTIVNINGLTEKGPYLSGSTVSISELNESYSPTGRIFNTQIIQDDGSFQLNGIELNSNFLSLSATGFYYNEVLNNNSEAQLTMHAISDISDTSSININTITTLEKNRVEYLVANGNTFKEAKSKALDEVLSIFEIGNNDFEPEDLSISKAGDANAKLLAVSVILQGHLPIADLSELLSKISLDLRTDGILDNLNLGEQLIYNANRINLAEIRNNLESRFLKIGLTDAVVPPFEPYVKAFIETTQFEYKSRFEYPEEGESGKNILYPGFDETETGTHAMTAIIPEGSELKVKITGNNWVFPALQMNTGWDVGDLDRSDYSRVFTSNRSGEVDFELEFDIHSPDGPILNKVKVEIIENDEEGLIKDILLTDVELEIVYKEGLLYSHRSEFDTGEQSMGAYMGEGLSLKTIIRGDYWDLDETQEDTGWEFTALDPTDNSRIFTSIDGYDKIDILINIIRPPGDTLFDIFENFDADGNLIGIDTTIHDIRYDTPSAFIEVYENGSSTPNETHEILIDPY